jgi:hypothetical protein
MFYHYGRRHAVRLGRGVRCTRTDCQIAPVDIWDHRRRIQFVFVWVFDIYQVFERRFLFVSVDRDQVVSTWCWKLGFATIEWIKDALADALAFSLPIQDPNDLTDAN